MKKKKCRRNKGKRKVKKNLDCGRLRIAMKGGEGQRLIGDPGRVPSRSGEGERCIKKKYSTEGVPKNAGGVVERRQKKESRSRFT